MPGERFFYGGQAVIEGVLIRGRRCIALAVRRPEGDIYTTYLPMPRIYSGRLRRVPLVRGVLVLLETMVTGVRALNRSAVIAVGDTEGGEPSRLAIGGSLALALALGVGLFFLLPLFMARGLDPLLPSALASNLAEGVIRLAIFLLYIKAISLLPDVQRVFAYHGAEHMTIHAYEQGLPLEIRAVRRFPTAHPRCGTAFLLVVIVVAILVFSLLGRPSLVWSVVARILLLPVIAGISYEVIRFAGAHSDTLLGRALAAPGLMLQALTTARPRRDQIEVAIAAMKHALAGDGVLPPAGEGERGPGAREATG